MKITVKPQLSFHCQLSLSEIQSRALEALSGYSDDAFINMFYTTLGKHYLEPYEDGLRDFLKACRDQLRPQLQTIDEAKAVLRKNNL